MTFLSTFPTLFSKLCLSVLYWFMGIKKIASGMFFSKLLTFELSLLNFEFLTTSLLTTSPNSFKSTGKVFNLSTSKSSTYIFKLSRPVRTLTNLLMSSLSTTPFQAIKLLTYLAAKLGVSTSVTSFNYF